MNEPDIQIELLRREIEQLTIEKTRLELKVIQLMMELNHIRNNGKFFDGKNVIQKYETGFVNPVKRQSDGPGL